jgi:hypothetical protein
MDFIAAYANADYLSKYAREFIKISKECLLQEQSMINYLPIENTNFYPSNLAI